ncbi:MAG: hypothetical protein ACYDD7_10455, partial [Acidimicrobiales bacterium]
ARTFATTELDSAIVPGRATDGIAVACCVVARLRRPTRPVLAVVDGPLTPAARAVLDAALAVGVAVPVEAWGADGPALDADAHLDRLRGLVVAGRPDPVGLATDGSQLAEMLAIAGPIIAWGGVF